MLETILLGPTEAMLAQDLQVGIYLLRMLEMLVIFLETLALNFLET